jgi:CheY-like chemotaxis protein
VPATDRFAQKLSFDARDQLARRELEFAGAAQKERSTPASAQPPDCHILPRFSNPQTRTLGQTGMITTVLIVDDNSSVRHAWKQLLRRRPNVEIVGEASDGEEAVTFALRHRPSVILMDISMPRVDGFDATKRIRVAAPETHIIIVTANAHCQPGRSGRQNRCSRVRLKGRRFH